MIKKAKREDPWVECVTCGGTAKVHEVKAEWCETWNEDSTGDPPDPGTGEFERRTSVFPPAPPSCHASPRRSRSTQTATVALQRQVVAGETGEVVAQVALQIGWQWR